MLVKLSPIFVVDTKIIVGYNFVAPLNVINDKLKLIKEEKKIIFICFSKEATKVLDGYLLFSRIGS